VYRGFEALRQADPRPRSPTDCEQNQETEKAAKLNKGLYIHNNNNNNNNNNKFHIFCYGANTLRKEYGV
jgi:hypothetical protein